MRDKIKSNVEIVEYSSRSPSSIDIRIDDLQKIDDRSTDSDAKTITDEYIENQNLTRQISELSDVGNTSIDDVDTSNTSRIQSLEVDDDVDTSNISREESIDNEEEIISDDQETNNSQTDTTEIFEKEEALSQIDQIDIESPAKTDKSPLLEESDIIGDIDSLERDSIALDNDSTDDEISVVEIILKQDVVIGDTEYNLGDMLYLEEDTNRLIDPNTSEYVGILTSDIIYSQVEDQYVSDDELGGLLGELEDDDENHKKQLRNILSSSTDIDPDLASRINL